MPDELTQHYLITDDHLIALRDIQHAWRLDDEQEAAKNKFMPPFRILLRYFTHEHAAEVCFDTRASWDAAWAGIVQHLTRHHQEFLDGR